MKATLSAISEAAALIISLRQAAAVSSEAQRFNRNLKKKKEEENMKMQGNAHLHKLLAWFLFFCTWKECSALNMALLSQNTRNQVLKELYFLFGL